MKALTLALALSIAVHAAVVALALPRFHQETPVVTVVEKPLESTIPIIERLVPRKFAGTYKFHKKIEHLPKSVTQSNDGELIAKYVKAILKDNKSLGCDFATQIAKWYREQEKLYNYPDGLLVSMAHWESWHNPWDVSNKRARGLLQVKIVPTGKWAAEQLGLYNGKAVQDRINAVTTPENNIPISAYILNHYLGKTNGNLELALAKYSGGARGYAQKILKFRESVIL